MRKWSNLLNIFFHTGWFNHQLVIILQHDGKGGNFLRVKKKKRPWVFSHWFCCLWQLPSFCFEPPPRSPREPGGSWGKKSLKVQLRWAFHRSLSLPEAVSWTFENVDSSQMMGAFFEPIWKPISRWWFQRCFIFTPIWGRFPFWLIFFKWVETTN